MIHRDEINAKAEEFGVHQSDVQRDYVFGWLIGGLYAESTLRDQLVLKGGNALRKAYLPMTRFSADLDFTTTQGLDSQALLDRFNEICRFAEASSAVKFDIQRNKIVDELQIDNEKRIYKMRLYFHDFTGNADHITLRIRVDVTEYDRIHLPVQTRRLIHPYSDAHECNFEIRVVKLEEALADKMKCLLQRRYSFDLFDLVYAVFVNRELEINRREIVVTFLRKTIFEPSPVTARELLLGIPFHLLRVFWDNVVCPRISRFPFNQAVSLFREGLASLFESFSYGEHLAFAYFPAEFRNRILQAGSEMTLLRLVYDDVPRLVEPYSLVFKRRQDGLAQEYFYVWDRTGGRKSGEGIKAFVPRKLGNLENTGEHFEPRYEIQVAKAGDRTDDGYFAQSFSARRRSFQVVSRARLGVTRKVHLGPRYKVRCNYCGKVFTRKTPLTKLNQHTDGYGNRCYGRIGTRVF
jgi:predicted nucleotidyltransferase component of viral defense system